MTVYNIPILRLITAKVTSLSFGWNSAAMSMAIRGLGLVANFVSLIGIARFSDEETLGVLIILNGAAFFLGTLFSLGFPTQLLKSLPDHLVNGDLAGALVEYRRALRFTVLGCLFLVCGAGGVVSLQHLGFLAPKIGSLGSGELVALAVGGSCMALQFVGLSVIRARRQVAWSSVFQFCTPVLFLFSGFLFCHLAWPVVTKESGLTVFTVAFLANTVLVIAYAGRLLRGAGRTSIRPLDWREVRSFWLMGLLSSGAANLPFLLATFLLMQSQLASIAVPFRIANLPMTIVGTLGAYYAPLIRECHAKGDRGGRRRHLVNSQWIGGGLVAPLLFASFVCPEWVLGFFHVKSGEAVHLLQLFVLAQAIIASCGVCSQYLAMLDLSGWVNLWTVCSIIGVALCSISFFDWAGIFAIGASWALFSCWRQVALRLRCERIM